MQRLLKFSPTRRAQVKAIFGGARPGELCPAPRGVGQVALFIRPQA